MGFPPLVALKGRSLEWHFYPCPRCGKKGYYLVKNPNDADRIYPCIARCRYCHLQTYLYQFPKYMHISYVRLGRQKGSKPHP